MGIPKGCGVNRVIKARYPGVADDGTMIHKGRDILWDTKRRRVGTACPNRIAEWRDSKAPDALDLAHEDACARGAGVDSMTYRF